MPNGRLPRPIIAKLEVYFKKVLVNCRQCFLAIDALFRESILFECSTIQLNADAGEKWDRCNVDLYPRKLELHHLSLALNITYVM